MKRYVFFSLFIIFSLSGIFLYQYFSFNDGKLHVIFCNVGQGDGVLIRDPEGRYFMVDGGPDEKILACMERHMPFWRRDIAIGFVTHPHSDHFVGYISALKRYAFGYFVTEPLVNNTAVFKSFISSVKKKNVQLRMGKLGDSYKVRSGVSFRLVGPSESFLVETSPGGVIGESEGFANLVILLEYGDFEVLFTGDSQVLGLLDASEYMEERRIDILHVPHHGSRTGLSEAIVRDLRPSVAVVSVGKNTYGHPSREILSLLKKNKVPYFRTDQYGDVEIVSDGEKFWVKTQ